MERKAGGHLKDKNLHPDIVMFNALHQPKHTGVVAHQSIEASLEQKGEERKGEWQQGGDWENSQNRETLVQSLVITAAYCYSVLLEAETVGKQLTTTSSLW